ncbi:hypothetical protein [Sandaracinus amylolyticus]|nr:hypothetical protein [Sandaracinus amylolyticus]
MPIRSATIELVPVTEGPPSTVHVFVTIDGERARVKVPRVVAGTARDDGRTIEHVVRAELFDFGARGLVVVVKHAWRARGLEGRRGLEQSVWASRDGRSWASVDALEPGGTPIAWAEAGAGSL